MKVFLGGTCNSNWRKEFIDFLEYEKIEYYNPVVEGDWTHEEEQENEAHKSQADVLLWVISPRMWGFYSIYDLADLAINYPEKLMVCFMRHDKDNSGVDHAWTAKQMRSIKAINNRLSEKNIKVCSDIFEVHQQIRLLKGI